MGRCTRSGLGIAGNTWKGHHVQWSTFVPNLSNADTHAIMVGTLVGLLVQLPGWVLQALLWLHRHIDFTIRYRP